MFVFKSKLPRPVYWISLMLMVISLGGCATSSLFSPYPVQAAKIKKQLHENKTDKILKSLDGKRDSADKTLYMLERGRVAQLAERYDTSIRDFEIAIAQERAVEERATVSLTRMGAQGASLLTSDNALPYEAAGFEKVLMYQHQALNYLAQNDVEGAGVEVRRANLEQKLALERYHEEIAEAEAEARKKNYTPGSNEQRLKQQFQSMYAAVGEVKNSFQNAYTFYVSGLIYELLGQPNDAYIDYKKALEIAPQNLYLQRDVLRLAKELGFREDYDLFRQNFARAQPLPQGQGEVIVLFEDGFVPPKDEVHISIATHRGFHSVAFPIYRDVKFSDEHLVVSDARSRLGQTRLIANIHAMAIKDLQERIPAITIRQVLRILAKAEMQKQASDNLGGLAGAATMIYSAISETADRRNWLTLPRNAQILRMPTATGENELKFALQQRGMQISLKVNVKSQRPTIVRVVSTGRRLYATTLFN